MVVVENRHDALKGDRQELCRDSLERAEALQRAGRLDDAEQSCLRVLGHRPRHPEALSLLGWLHLQRHAPKQAAALLRSSLAERADQPQAWLHLGVALRGLGDDVTAETAYRSCLSRQPESAVAHYNLGQLLAGQRPEEATVHLEHAAGLHPGWPQAENALGIVHLRGGDLEAASAAFRRAAEADPGWAVPHLNLGELELSQGATVAALAAFDQALVRDPSSMRAHSNRAYTLLELGDFEAGWPEHEWRFDTGGRVPRRQGYETAPVWQGERFPGRTLVVWMEQGLGDALQFVRYLPHVAARGGRVWLQTAPQLARLLGTCEGVDRVLLQDPPPEEVDLQIPLLSLPARFHTRLETIPAQVPYLHPRQSTPRRVREALDSAAGIKVGLVWRSGTLAPNGARRDLDTTALNRLLAVSGVHWFALQFGEMLHEQLPHLPRHVAGRVTDLGHDLGDFATTAAIVQELDLIVSVDTAMAHLAGALGRPAWVFLPQPVDWRWLRDRDDSPWYPSMRLYRQETPGRWDQPTQRLLADLANFSPSLSPDE